MGSGRSIVRTAWLCCLAALLLTAALRASAARQSSGGDLAQQPAQQPAPPQPSQPIFRTGANVVRVDVTVLDRRGRPVSELVAEDFEIEEDGVPQQIQSFKLVEATGHPVAGDDRSLAIRSREDIAMEAARDEVRVIVILWDEYSIGQMDSAIRARRFLTSFVTSAIAPLDLVAIMDQFTPVDMIPFTRNRSELTERIRTLKGRRGIYFPPRNLAEEAHLLEMRSIGRIRAEVTLSALQAAAIRLGGLREGRKAILFVSEGPAYFGPDMYSRLQDLFRAANDANTAIYTVDPRGLALRRLPNGMLAEIALNTGGKAFLNSNEPERLLGHVVQDLSAYYLIGYESNQNPSDGKYHRIAVRVKRKGVDVLARRGYWAPSAADVARARATAAAAEPPPEIKRALTALATTRRAGRVELWLGTARTPDGAEVTLAWSPRHSPTENGDAPASLSVVARGLDGRVWFDRSITERCTRFTAPPGALQVRIVYRAAGGEDIGGETREVVVPDFSGRALALSTPVVLRTRTEAERRALGASFPAAPFPGREFLRTDRLMIRFQLYGAASASVSAALLDRTGRVRTALPVGPAGDAAGTYQIDLPLTFAAPGEYLVAVTAANSAEKVEALVPLRVLSR